VRMERMGIKLSGTIRNLLNAFELLLLLWGNRFQQLHPLRNVRSTLALLYGLSRVLIVSDNLAQLPPTTFNVTSCILEPSSPSTPMSPMFSLPRWEKNFMRSLSISSPVGSDLFSTLLESILILYRMTSVAQGWEIRSWSRRSKFTRSQSTLR